MTFLITFFFLVTIYLLTKKNPSVTKLQKNVNGCLHSGDNFLLLDKCTLLIISLKREIIHQNLLFIIIWFKSMTRKVKNKEHGNILQPLRLDHPVQMLEPSPATATTFPFECLACSKTEHLSQRHTDTRRWHDHPRFNTTSTQDSRKIDEDSRDPFLPSSW